MRKEVIILFAISLVFLTTLVSANTVPLNPEDCSKEEFQILWEDHFFSAIDGEELQLLKTESSCKILGELIEGNTISLAYLDTTLTLADEQVNFLAFKGESTSEGKTKIQSLSLSEISFEEAKLLVHFPDYWQSSTTTIDQTSSTFSTALEIAPATFIENPTKFTYYTSQENPSTTSGSLSFNEEGSVLKNSNVVEYLYTHNVVVDSKYYSDLESTKEFQKIILTKNQDLADAIFLSEYFSNALSAEVISQSTNQNGKEIISSNFNSETNSLQLKPISNFTGDLILEIEFSNKIDTTTKEITISVLDVTTPISTKEIPIIKVSQGETKTINLLDYFADEEELTFSVTQTPNFNLLIDRNYLKISIVGDFVGITTQTIVATDPTGSKKSAPIIIEALDPNEEVLTNVGLVVEHATDTKNRVYYVGEKIGLFILVLGDNLRYNWKIDGNEIRNPTENVYVEGLEEGEHTIEVTVTDGEDKLQHSWDLIVQKKLEITPTLIISFIILIIVLLAIAYLLTYLYLEKKKKEKIVPNPGMQKDPSKYIENQNKNSEKNIKKFTKESIKEQDQISNNTGQ